MFDKLKDSQVYILGGGVTGLAAGYATGLPVFEAMEAPGGICSSYYMRGGGVSDQQQKGTIPRKGDPLRGLRNACSPLLGGKRYAVAPEDGEAYRFEIGGGHWIFGGDPEIVRFMSGLTPMRKYVRSSSVYFPEKRLYIPYPLQNNLRYLDAGLADKAVREMENAQGSFRTMREWLRAVFGAALCEMFFHPFHSLYTAGLDAEIAPQDGYKSPVDFSLVRRGARSDTEAVGYNVSYLYPEAGLNALAEKLAERCDIRFGKRVVRIDTAKKEIRFADGESLTYDALLSTLPLNKMMELTGLEVDHRADPYTSVLVLNIGALRGPRCPEDHWLYIPQSRSGFHRVGFYSNVDLSFLPRSTRGSGSRAAQPLWGSRVSLYVERAFANGKRPSDEKVEAYARRAIRELQEWGFIGAAEVVDPTWIDVAYTWSYPESHWKEKALKSLEGHDIHQSGRYGRWLFQGISDSIRDGLRAGAAFRRDIGAVHEPPLRQLGGKGR